MCILSSLVHNRNQIKFAEMHKEQMLVMTNRRKLGFMSETRKSHIKNVIEIINTNLKDIRHTYFLIEIGIILFNKIRRKNKFVCDIAMAKIIVCSGIFQKLKSTYENGKFNILNTATVCISTLILPVASNPVVNVLDIASLIANSNINLTKLTVYSGTTPNHNCNMYGASIIIGRESNVKRLIENLLPLIINFL